MHYMIYILQLKLQYYLNTDTPIDSMYSLSQYFMGNFSHPLKVPLRDTPL